MFGALIRLFRRLAPKMIGVSDPATPPVPRPRPKRGKCDLDDYTKHRNIRRAIKIEQEEARAEHGHRQVFHGGCLRCTQPLDKCQSCMYMLPDWSLPDLSNKGED